MSLVTYRFIISHDTTRETRIARKFQNEDERRKLPVRLCLDNPFQPTVTLHIESYRANQMTGFYMKCKTELKWVKRNVTEHARKIFQNFIIKHASLSEWPLLM